MKRPILLTIFSLFCLTPYGFAGARHIMVIAHRGESIHYPANTLPAYRGAIKLGVDYFETDVRTTADGKLIIMHNKDVDATTNGHGLVRDMVLAQIRKLDAGVKFGPQFRGTKVPTFDEVLRLAEGRVGVYVDCKDIAAPALVAAIDRHHMENHVVIYGYSIAFMKEVHRLRPRIKVMPETVSTEIIRREIEELQPRVFAFSSFDFNDAIIAIAKQAKADIYVDRLGAADNPASWQNAIDRGATGIQTNRPAQLLQYLRSHGYHQ